MEEKLLYPAKVGTEFGGGKGAKAKKKTGESSPKSFRANWKGVGELEVKPTSG